MYNKKRLEGVIIQLKEIKSPYDFEKMYPYLLEELKQALLYIEKLELNKEK